MKSEHAQDGDPAEAVQPGDDFCADLPGWADRISRDWFEGESARDEFKRTGSQSQNAPRHQRAFHARKTFLTRSGT